MPAPSEISNWAIAVLLSLTLAVAAISDVKHRLIPNSAVLIIVILFAIRAVAEPWVSIISSLEAALIVFFIGFGLYAFRIIGAGDSKLITAVALFVGLERLPQFIFATSIVGGALAVGSLAANPKRALVMIQMRGKGDFGRKIPYGVAIAVAGLYTFFPAMSEH
jgi:prepilin peptidase CpaA